MLTLCQAASAATACTALLHRIDRQLYCVHFRLTGDLDTEEGCCLCCCPIWLSTEARTGSSLPQPAHTDLMALAPGDYKQSALGKFLCLDTTFVRAHQYKQMRTTAGQ